MHSSRDIRLALHVSAPLEPEQWKRALGTRAGRRRPCVLLIEDQRIFRQIVVEILSRECDLLAAANGVEGLELYARHAPDMVFLDIDLPDINGQEILNAITAADQDCFVVMLTANHLEEEITRAIQAGARGYIVKPFTRQRIEEYFSLWRQENT